MKKEKRVALLQNLAIITLILISLYYLNCLFSKQINLLFTAVNSILLPFGIALFISYLISPVIKLIEKHFKIRYRWLSILIVFILFAIIFTIFVLIIVNLVIEQAHIIMETDWTLLYERIENIVIKNEFLHTNFLKIKSSLENQSFLEVFDVIKIFKGTMSIIVTIVLIPVFLVFILIDRKQIFDGILTVFPKSNRHHFEELGIRANTIIEKYFNGRFMSMFIMSIFFTIMFFVFGFGFKLSLFFGFTLGFLDIIPYVGPTVGILLPVLYSFTIPELLLFDKYAFIGLIVIDLIGQFIQGNILQPLIMGKEVNLHPLLVLSSFIFFGALFGVTGIILAIPITGIIKTSSEYYTSINK